MNECIVPNATFEMDDELTSDSMAKWQNAEEGRLVLRVATEWDWLQVRAVAFALQLGIDRVLEQTSGMASRPSF